MDDVQCMFPFWEKISAIYCIYKVYFSRVLKLSLIEGVARLAISFVIVLILAFKNIARILVWFLFKFSLLGLLSNATSFLFLIQFYTTNRDIWQLLYISPDFQLKSLCLTKLLVSFLGQVPVSTHDCTLLQVKEVKSHNRLFSILHKTQLPGRKNLCEVGQYTDNASWHICWCTSPHTC